MLQQYRFGTGIILHCPRIGERAIRFLEILPAAAVTSQHVCLASEVRPAPAEAPQDVYPRNIMSALFDPRSNSLESDLR